MAEIKRNLQTEGGLYIDKWWTGLYKNRSPLFTPVSALGITIVGRRDTLIDGLNMMVSPQYSLRRRYGNSKACSIPFGVGEWPLGFTSFQNLSGTIYDIADTQTNVYTFDSGSKASIYTKTAGAGQSSFNSVLNWLYWVDGKVVKKFDGTNVWNMGIAAPTSEPTVITTETGAQAVGISWEPSAWYSTMGLLVDSNGNMQQLIAVNNPSPAAPYTSDYGTSTVTAGQPPFSHTSGDTTIDGGVTWKCEGPLATYDFFGGFYKYYLDTSFYGNGTQTIIPGYLWDEVHGVMYAQVYDPGTGVAITAGPPRPNFRGQPWDRIIKNFCTFYDGGYGGAGNYDWPYSQPKAWQASHAYASATDTGDVYIYEPAVPPYSNQTPVFLQRCIVAGTSASGSSYNLNWSTVTSATTTDNQLTWVNLGSATWQAGTSYTAWTNSTNYTFNAIKDSNGNIQVCVVSGVSGSGPTWGTNYGQQTSDGTVIWVCVGQDTGWIKNQIYYLPKSGFAPPYHVAFGGTAILDTVTGTVQYVSNTGVSGASAPSFSGTKGVETLDGSGGTQITWVCNGAPLSQGLSWSYGYAYAYSYKARSATDFYSVPSVGPNGGPAVIPTPPGYIGQIGVGYTGGGLPAPTGSESGQISTASPVFLITTSNPGAQNVITVTGSTDPQVDTIVIWRSKDGGGSSNMFELTEIPNPPVTNGIAGTVTFTDFQPDSVLNTQIIAPIADVNDPPPAGASILVWYGGRLWAASGNTLYFSAGPDAFATSGVGTESWPPGNNFTLPGNITNLIATSTGLIISVLDNAYLTTGTTSSTFTVPLLWQKNFGVPSINASDQDGDNVFFFTTKGQVWHFSANGLENIGDLNANDFAAMTPGNVYVAVHRSGIDEGVFISDGVSNIWRYSTKSQSWDTPMGIVGGCGAIASIETSVANWNLIVGRDTGAGYILKRDLTLYTDDSLAYHAFATVGSLVVAPPRQTTLIESVLIQATFIGTYPTISVLVNEIADVGIFPSTFVTLPNPVNDPWNLPPQRSIFQKRHDFKANTVGPLPQVVQHMQVKVDFGMDTVANELLGLGLA